MPYVRCIECKQLIPAGEQQKHRQSHRWDKSHSHWSWNRDLPAHKRFARAVKKRDGHRCTKVTNGSRCTVTEGLVAHHLVPLAAEGGHNPSNGVTLCRAHHRAVDRHAR